MEERPSEDDLIARLFAPIAGPEGLGLRDDAACLQSSRNALVVTNDMLVADVHFFADDPPHAIAAKALRVNLSDLAAKAARPRGFLLGLALPPDWTAAWLEEFARGLGADAERYACPLVGGDTVATHGPLTLSITAFGDVAPRAFVPRPGVRAGDILFVSGTIGDAALGLHVRRGAIWTERLDIADRDVLVDRYRLPRPRLALAPALAAHARAAMDISDGFVGDLAKMLALAGLTADVRLADVPLSPAARRAIASDADRLATLLTGGDDYEILCAVPAEEADAFVSAAARAGVSVARLGVAQTGDAPPRILDAAGDALPLGRGRFQHFV